MTDIVDILYFLLQFVHFIMMHGSLVQGSVKGPVGGGGTVVGMLWEFCGDSLGREPIFVNFYTYSTPILARPLVMALCLVL